MPRTIESTKLDAATKPAVIDLLYRLGDDSLIIGHRNSEWTGLGPILEEDIAFSSMAQDKMGHALAFYRLLDELGEADPERLAYERGPDKYRCCSLVTLEFLDSDNSKPDLSNNPVRDELVSRGDWAGSLVRQFLFSEADAIRMAALEESAYEPLAQLARKLRGELKYHTLHGRLMMEKLGRATPESRERLQSALTHLWPHALGIFEPTHFDDQLANSGICPPESELCQRWRSEVEPIIEKSGLSIPSKSLPNHGGRAGKHGAQLTTVLDAMQKVYKLSPGAIW